MSNIEIRSAAIEDAALIHGFVRDLAIYEKAEVEVTASVEDIARSLFAEDSNVSALICSADNIPVGFAVYFFNYSTWLGKPGLYLEDLYVSPQYRSKGAGKALLKRLANIAVAKHCGRFEWSVLDWNTSAIDFYQSIGARPQPQWVAYRLAGTALTDFAHS